MTAEIFMLFKLFELGAAANVSWWWLVVLITLDTCATASRGK